MILRAAVFRPDTLNTPEDTEGLSVWCQENHVAIGTCSGDKAPVMPIELGYEDTFVLRNMLDAWLMRQRMKCDG